MDDILGPEYHADQYHVDVIREKLTRTIPVVFPDMVDEVRSTVAEHIQTHGNGTCALYVF